MQLDFQSLFGLHVHSCNHCDPPPPTHPPAFGLIYEGAIGQPRQTTFWCDPLTKIHNARTCIVTDLQYRHFLQMPSWNIFSTKTFSQILLVSFKTLDCFYCFCCIKKGSEYILENHFLQKFTATKILNIQKSTLPGCKQYRILYLVWVHAVEGYFLNC